MTVADDYYSQCEDGLAALFRTLTDYIKHDWQVSDDNTNLSKGADYFVFLDPGRFREDEKNMDGETRTYVAWEILFEIRVRFQDFSSSKKAIKAFRSALYNVVKKHRRLDYPRPVIALGVFNVLLEATENVRYWADKPNQTAPSWIIQKMKATVLQLVPVG